MPDAEMSISSIYTKPFLHFYWLQKDRRLEWYWTGNLDTRGIRGWRLLAPLLTKYPQLIGVLDMCWRGVGSWNMSIGGD